VGGHDGVVGDEGPGPSRTVLAAVAAGGPVGRLGVGRAGALAPGLGRLEVPLVGGRQVLDRAGRRHEGPDGEGPPGRLEVDEALDPGPQLRRLRRRRPAEGGQGGRVVQGGRQLERLAPEAAGPEASEEELPGRPGVTGRRPPLEGPEVSVHAASVAESTSPRPARFAPATARPRRREYGHTVDRAPRDRPTGGDDADDATLGADPAMASAASDGATRAAGSGRLSAAPPRSLGGYVLLEELGRGSFGSVYRARRPGSGRDFALKVLRTADAEAVERFRAEVLLGRRLRHPGLVAAVDAGRDRGVPYAVMEFVAGETLDRRLGRPVDPEWAARVVAAVARAVAAAHAAGVVHRDLKPANVILEAGTDRPRVTDLGLARDHSLVRLTRTGDTLGTPAYMAPEQCEGARDVDGRADVYGLGVILYECLTGRRPFRAPSAVLLFREVVKGAFPRPREVAPEVPSAAEAICLRAMARDPGDRYATAEGLADDLEAFADDAAAVAPARRIDRARVAAGAVLAAAVVAAAAVVLVGRGSGAGVGRAPTPDGAVAADGPTAADAPAAPAEASPPAPPPWPTGPAWGDAPEPPPHRDGELVEGPGWALATGLDRAALAERVEDLRRRGLRPAVVTVNVDGPAPRFLAAWVEATGRWAADLVLPEADLPAAVERRRADGLEVAVATLYPSVAGRRVATVWVEASPGDRAATAGLTTRAYQAQFMAAREQDRRPVWHSGLGAGDARRLSLVWARGRTVYMGVHDRPEANFVGTLIGVQGRGITLRCATRYGAPGAALFGGLWEKDGRGSLLVHDLPASEHRALVAALAAEGYRPLFLMERGRAPAVRFTSSWVRPAERTWDVAGEAAADLPAAQLDVAVRDAVAGQGASRAALAVARGGRLVLARGYAWVPDGVAPTDPHARFRLGSLAAPLTATAALRLVDAGRLGLEQPVDVHLPAFAAPEARRLRVGHLLAHRSGWPHLADLVGGRAYRVRVFPSMILDNSEEPDLLLGQPLPLGRAGLVRVLARRPPEVAPGARFAESDVGYALLARVIEVAAGAPYADVVARTVLAPAGVAGLLPGRNGLAGRLPGEVLAESPRIGRDVRGTGALVPRAYGARDSEAFDGWAGWVGSAPALARFGDALADADRRLLGPATARAMWSPAEDDSGVGLGWRIERTPAGVRAWAASRLPGASGRLEVLPDGTVWVLLVNREVSLDAAAAQVRHLLAGR